MALTSDECDIVAGEGESATVIGADGACAEDGTFSMTTP